MWTLAFVVVFVSLRSTVSEVVEEIEPQVDQAVEDVVNSTEACPQNWTLTNKKQCWRFFPVAQLEPSNAMLVCRRNGANLVSLNDNADSFFAYHMLKELCFHNQSLCGAQVCLQNVFNPYSAHYARTPLHVEELVEEKYYRYTLHIERPIQFGDFIHFVFKPTKYNFELDVGNLNSQYNPIGHQFLHFKVEEDVHGRDMLFDIFSQRDWTKQFRQHDHGSYFTLASERKEVTTKRVLFMIDATRVAMFNTVADPKKQLFAVDTDVAKYVRDSMTRMWFNGFKIYDAFVAKSGIMQQPITSPAVHCFWGYKPNSFKIPVLKINFDRTFALCERESHVETWNLLKTSTIIDLRAFLVFGGITVVVAVVAGFSIFYDQEK